MSDLLQNKKIVFVSIQEKKGIKYRRNLRWGTYDSNLNLEWLQHETNRMSEDRGDELPGHKAWAASRGD